jgi:hypothetical protein
MDAAPLYEICCSCVPVMLWNSWPDSCCELPAGGAERQSVRLGLERGNDLVHRLVLAVVGHHQHVADRADQVDGHEVLHRVIAQLLVEERIDRVRGDGAAHDRVAVGVGAPRPGCRGCPTPGLFSMTTGWPSRCDKPSATIRAVASDTPPGENGTTYLIGLLGQVSAAAENASESPASTTAGAHGAPKH